MGWKENKAKYDKEYAKKNIAQINLKFNKISDADILEFLGSQENIQKYMKDLIRADIEKNKQ